MKSDIEIASSATLQPVQQIVEKMGLDQKYLSPYGKYVGKIDLNAKDQKKRSARTVLVTAMTPTPAGEGKTTVSIGLSEALNRIGHKSIVALREASLGPVFGVKGGATGGGYSQVLPMADINLHFTGDIHAVGTAHNLLAALIDNEYARTGKTCLLPRNIMWNRVMDMNDRALRNIVVGLGSDSGQVRESKFEITASSEIMAVLGLTSDMVDLKKRLSEIIVAESSDNRPLTVHDFGAEGALAILLKDAIKPNLVQTLEGNPAIIHTGPFANIAHGTNSLISTDIAARYSDIAVIEAGFASDLGAEKYFNLVSRQSGATAPDAVVIVATVRALKYHGGVSRKKLDETNIDAVEKGFVNLAKHIENMKSFNRPVLVAVNSFVSDADEELELVKKLCMQHGTSAHIVDVWGKGGDGALSLAEDVWYMANSEQGDVAFTYDLKDSIADKISKVAANIYGAEGVHFLRSAKKKIEQLESWGYGHLPVCMAKTQSSLSDNPAKKGRPEGFTVDIRNLKVSAGAGFIVVYTSDIMTMPGLPARPAAQDMDIDEYGIISGLF